jgi:putative oxidoreductase
MAAAVTGSRRQLTLGSTVASTSAHPVTFITFLGATSYALVALGLRFVMARVFFLFGQTMIDGPTVPFTWLTSRLGSWLGRSVEFSVVLPVEIKEATFQAFRTQYAGLPMPPEVSAQVFAYALFALPICLILGFATRLAALGLLAITVLLSVYVAPEALWSTHVYWGAILLVLITVGPGAISLDAAIRSLQRA